jgi:hypothetical protein
LLVVVVGELADVEVVVWVVGVVMPADVVDVVTMGTAGAGVVTV